MIGCVVTLVLYPVLGAIQEKSPPVGAADETTPPIFYIENRYGDVAILEQPQVDNLGNRLFFVGRHAKNPPLKLAKAPENQEILWMPFDEIVHMASWNTGKMEGSKPFPRKSASKDLRVSSRGTDRFAMTIIEHQFKDIILFTIGGRQFLVGKESSDESFVKRFAPTADCWIPIDRILAIREVDSSIGN